jgi:hypothetical protein
VPRWKAKSSFRSAPSNRWREIHTSSLGVPRLQAQAQAAKKTVLPNLLMLPLRWVASRGRSQADCEHGVGSASEVASPRNPRNGFFESPTTAQSKGTLNHVATTPHMFFGETSSNAAVLLTTTRRWPPLLQILLRARELLRRVTRWDAIERLSEAAVHLSRRVSFKSGCSARPGRGAAPDRLD